MSFKIEETNGDNHPLFKLMALVMKKCGVSEVLITESDYMSLPEKTTTLMMRKPDGISIRIIEDKLH